MDTLTLDTSGHVWPLIDYGMPLRWLDLSPFAQGYVEAAFRWFSERNVWTRADFADPERHEQALLDGTEVPGDLTFSDLASETLAAILRDCEAATTLPHQWEPSRGAGEAFWHNRQHGHEPTFPPLTPYLGDDGKVGLREAA